MIERGKSEMNQHRASQQGGKAETIEEWEQKLKKKTATDDCMTPPAVYSAVVAWAVNRYGYQGRPIVRPFWPGKDYKTMAYPEGCVVIDNPPFSIMSELLRFYTARGIDYFLFANGMTVLGCPCKSHVIVGTQIIYDNALVLNTAFVSSQGPLIEVSPELADAIDTAQQKAKTTPKKPYKFDPHIISIGKLLQIARRGEAYTCERGHFVRKLDAGPPGGIYGAGFIVGDKDAIIDRVPGKKLLPLSEREKEIVRRLNEGT